MPFEAHGRSSVRPRGEALLVQAEADRRGAFASSQEELYSVHSRSSASGARSRRRRERRNRQSPSPDPEPLAVRRADGDIFAQVPKDLVGELRPPHGAHARRCRSTSRRLLGARGLRRWTSRTDRYRLGSHAERTKPYVNRQTHGRRSSAELEQPGTVRERTRRVRGCLDRQPRLADTTRSIDRLRAGADASNFVTPPPPSRRCSQRMLYGSIGKLLHRQIKSARSSCTDQPRQVRIHQPAVPGAASCSIDIAQPVCCRHRGAPQTPAAAPPETHRRLSSDTITWPPSAAARDRTQRGRQRGRRSHLRPTPASPRPLCRPMRTRRSTSSGQRVRSPGRAKLPGQAEIGIDRRREGDAESVAFERGR